jgi:type I restriction enzyme S subunit
VRINDLHSAGAITIQNGFPCGNWNNEGSGILQLRPFNVTDGGQIDLSTIKYV